MELFNIGILEFLFILLLAFIVLGPEKSVKIAGDFGRWVRRFFDSPIWKDISQTSKDLRDIPQKIMNEAEIEETLKDIDRSFSRHKDADIQKDGSGKEKREV